jgi:hypothetical protein
MIANAAVFICSICGEASVNICAYCTKDACSNHRCERCKRCSDCCECEFPLSAEEPVALEAVTQPVSLPVPEPELESPQPEPEPPSPPIPTAPPFGSPVFLTAEESSVFAEESGPREPRIFGESSVFAEEDDSTDFPQHDDPTKLG